MTLSNVLPDLDALDTESLKALVVEKHTVILEKEAQLASQQDEMQRLKLLLAKLQRMQFGRSSEKLAEHIDQLELQLEELETNKTAKATVVVADHAVAAQPARKPLSADLPREIETLSPKETECPDCGGTLKRLGEDVSEMLEFVPGRFKVIRTIRPKLACNRCDVIVQEPAPHRPIDRGLAGPGLLAHVLVGKYADHLPLYRQSEIYAREGIELDRSTLAGWVGGASCALEPLVDAIRKYVLDAEKIHADDIPVPVLAPGNGKTKTGRLWTYVRDDRPAGSTDAPAVWFAYSPDRKSEHPATHLATFRGRLQADAFPGFNRLYEAGGITEIACWAHARRKFYDLYEAHQSPIAKEALERIGALYAIEREIRGRPPDERKKVRKERARSLLEDLKQWFKTTLRKLSKKSEVTVAIHYALGRWTSLLRYCDDGTLEIDNNAAERALRAVALGRKNYLFAGSNAGGERAAAMYTLIGSAKLNGIDPEVYLSHVLARIADHAITRIGELLPWNVEIPNRPETD
ncbi:MAG TPA: IS66 family transposase [Pyrinomonadaceae bacterium]|jgi:transposase|nr:IS66 family transposase [Pyrinomonadaceae bacterium]